MYTCMYMYVYIHVFTYIYIHTYMCMYGYVYVNAYAHMYTHITVARRGSSKVVSLCCSVPPCCNEFCNVFCCPVVPPSVFLLFLS